MIDFTQLITNLREEAEWAEANEYEARIMLSAHLAQAADAIEELSLTAESYKRSMEKWADEAANVEEKCKEWLKVKGKCPTCARCSDNIENRTRCPIEEHYALPLDGYCHLYEPMKENENGDK